MPHTAAGLTGSEALEPAQGALGSFATATLSPDAQKVSSLPFVATSPYAQVITSAASAVETLSFHESNSERAGHYDTAVSWRAYKDYLTGLIDKLKMQEHSLGTAAAESLVLEIGKAIEQVPPRA